MEDRLQQSDAVCGTQSPKAIYLELRKPLTKDRRRLVKKWGLGEHTSGGTSECFHTQITLKRQRRRVEYVHEYPRQG